ncbi:MAG TPA: hypothetical protein VEJ63_04815 [Planctomycetota bacterium]|nr:hypothetical protein [Planctomycetota bacterium]
MHLRHVLVIMSAIGAFTALVMALNYYRRLKEAERLMFINNTTPGPDSILHTGMAQVVGLLALAIIFLGVLLALLAALKDPRFKTAVATGVVPDAETEGSRKDAETQSTETDGEKAAGETLPPVS